MTTNNKPAYLIEAEERMPDFYVDWDKNDAIKTYFDLKTRWTLVFFSEAWEVAAPMQNGKRPRKHKVLNDADWALVAERAEAVIRQEIASKNA